MGKDFTPIKANGFSIEDAYNKLFSGRYEIIEASEEKYFSRIPQLSEVKEIDVGYAGTKESIIRLKNNGFAVVNKSFDL